MTKRSLRRCTAAPTWTKARQAVSLSENKTVISNSFKKSREAATELEPAIELEPATELETATWTFTIPSHRSATGINKR